MMIENNLKGLSAHRVPFSVGDLDAGKSFVHVLDDATLDIIMRTLDTISDFTAYLRKKELLVRSARRIFAAGDEELLAAYLTEVNSNGEHDLCFRPKPIESACRKDTGSISKRIHR